LVIPLHVVAGFLESDRGIRDSGVRPVNAMVGCGRSQSQKKDNKKFESKAKDLEIVLKQVNF
jgi:hypothetical protein